MNSTQKTCKQPHKPKIKKNPKYFGRMSCILFLQTIKPGAYSKKPQESDDLIRITRNSVSNFFKASSVLGLSVPCSACVSGGKQEPSPPMTSLGRAAHGDAALCPRGPSPHDSWSWKIFHVPREQHPCAQPYGGAEGFPGIEPKSRIKQRITQLGEHAFWMFPAGSPHCA